MPCIQVKTNVSTSREKADAIKAALGQAIGFLPGKSEDWLMVAIEDGCHMYFGGRGGRPIAMVEVKILGSSIDKDGAKRMTGEITRVLGGVLGFCRQIERDLDLPEVPLFVCQTRSGAVGTGRLVLSRELIIFQRIPQWLLGMPQESGLHCQGLR